MRRVQRTVSVTCRDIRSPKTKKDLVHGVFFLYTGVMKKIKLTQGYVTFVDDEDFEELSKYKWYYKHQKGGGYATRNSLYVKGKSRTSIRMHRHLMETPSGFETDHENGNKLDNQRSNLRIVTKSQNQWNRKKQVGSSKHKGVYWNKKNQRWHVQLQMNGKKIWLGYYATEEEAAAAYQKGVMKFFGRFGRLS